MKCPVCNLTVRKLLGGGYCPNQNCRGADGKRTRLHALKNRYITKADKDNVDKLIERFQRNVQMVHGLQMGFPKSQRMKAYIAAYHLMDKTNEFLDGLGEPHFTDRIVWFDFIVDVIDWIFTETGDWAKNLTNLTALDGALFYRAAPHVYTAHRARLLQEDNDELVIARNGSNGITLPQTLF